MAGKILHGALIPIIVLVIFELFYLMYYNCVENGLEPTTENMLNSLVHPTKCGKRNIESITKTMKTGAFRGFLMGFITGGIEGGVLGGIILAAVNPIVALLDY
jgi:hypothetical protein